MNFINLEVLGEVDHTRVKAPYVRAVDINKELNVTLYDVRFRQPNVEFLEPDVLHSIEHLVAVELMNALGRQFVNFGLMGCQTGAYLTVGSGVDASGALVRALELALTRSEVPLCNEFQCGRFRNHNLIGAQKVIADFLEKKSSWNKVY